MTPSRSVLAACVRAQVEALVHRLPVDAIVVSGGARGVDTWAVEAAQARGLETVVHTADWSRGRGAGMARNQVVVGDCHQLFAFWNGSSTGTANAIDAARAAGKYVVVYAPSQWIEHREAA